MPRITVPPYLSVPITLRPDHGAGQAPGHYSIANNAVSVPHVFFFFAEIYGLSAQKSQQLRKCWLLASFDKSWSTVFTGNGGCSGNLRTLTFSSRGFGFTCQGVEILQKSNFRVFWPCQPLFQSNLQSRVQLPTAEKNRHGTRVLAYPERG